MLKEYFAKKKIRKFLISMTVTLANDYGRSDEYAEGQVKTAATKLGYTNDEIQGVAVAIFCNKEAAEAFGVDQALVKKYRGYREQNRVSIDQAIGGGGFDGGGGGGD